MNKIQLPPVEEVKEAWAKPELNMISVKERTLNDPGPSNDLALLSS